MKQNDSNSVKKEVVFVLNVNFIIFLIKRARLPCWLEPLARLSGIVALCYSSLFTCYRISPINTGTTVSAFTLILVWVLVWDINL